MPKKKTGKYPAAKKKAPAKKEMPHPGMMKKMPKKMM